VLLIKEKAGKMSKLDSVVAVFHTHPEAEQAVKDLQRGGIDMKSVSIIAKEFETDEQVVGYYNTGDRMKRWGGIGAFWGGFWGLLFGSALFVIPGVGPLLMAGPVVAWIVGALEGAVVVGGVGALGAGLFSIGIAKDSVLKYETAVKSDKYLLLVSGSSSDVLKAKEILGESKPAHLDLHLQEELVSSTAK
jgi:uncharacterized membrane protein